MYRAWIRAISTTGQISLWSVPVFFTIAANRERLDSPDLLPDTLASAAVQLTAFDPQPTAIVSPDDRRNPSVESPPDAVIAVETNTPAVSSGGLQYPPSIIRIADAELDAVMADMASMHVLYEI